MTNKEALEVMITERTCVERQDTPLCDRNCAECDLVLPSDKVVRAYEMAIQALSQMERYESKDVIDPYDMKYIRCGKD